MYLSDLFVTCRRGQETIGIDEIVYTVSLRVCVDGGVAPLCIPCSISGCVPPNNINSPLPKMITNTTALYGNSCIKGGQSESPVFGDIFGMLDKISKNDS